MKAIHKGLSGQLPGYRRSGGEPPYVFSGGENIKNAYERSTWRRLADCVFSCPYRADTFFWNNPG
jgi:hypothetical protein